MGINGFTRFGVRQWFPLEIPGFTEEIQIKRMLDRLFRNDILEQLLNTKPDDLALTFESDDAEHWKKRRIEFGAMDKSQWEARVPYPELKIVRETGTTNWRDGIIESLPEYFLYLDIDTFWHNQDQKKKSPDKTAAESVEFLRIVQQQNLLVARNLVQLIKG